LAARSRNWAVSRRNPPVRPPFGDRNQRVSCRLQQKPGPGTPFALYRSQRRTLETRPRRTSMRMRKLMPKKKSAPRSKKPTRFAGTVGAQAIFLVVIGVVAAAAMLIAARQSSQPSDVAAMDFQQ